MPWFLRMFFLLALLVFLVDLYWFWSVNRALHQVLPDRAAHLRLVLIVLFIWANALPVYGLFKYFVLKQPGFYMAANPLTLADYLLVFPYWIFFIVMIESLPYLLLLDLAKPLLGRLAGASGHWHRRLLLLPWAQLAIVLILLIWVPARSYVDTYRVRLHRLEIPVQGLPSGLAGLRLALLSDVQVDRFTGANKLNQVAQLLAHSPPDLLLFAGDLVTSGQAFIPAGVKFMCALPAGLGRVACLGDHDVWSGPQPIQNGLRDCGWQFLDNQHHLFPYRGGRILVTGLTHVYSRRLSSQEVDALLAKAPEAELKVLLVHQPSPHILQAAARYGYHLVLAGHTHGGQVLFHPFGKTVALSLVENHFFRGRKTIGTTTAVITNGVGLTFVPLRYGARAEVTEITLSSR